MKIIALKYLSKFTSLFFFFTHLNYRGVWLNYIAMALTITLALFVLTSNSFCDAAEPWALSFQESASPIAEGIVDFHDHLFYFLILILVAVTWILTLIVGNNLKGPALTSDGAAVEHNGVLRPAKISLKDLNHGSVIEIVWTLTPAFILVLIAFPSFRLLYLMDEIVEPLITVKAVGFLGGLTSHIKNKIKDAIFKILVQKFSYNGEPYTKHGSFYFSYSYPNIYNSLIIRLFHSRCRAINRIGPPIMKMYCLYL